MTLQQKLLAKQSKKGFTLVELVVVIAILAILAAIAIPAVVGIIDNAQKSAKNSNAAALDGAAKKLYAGVTAGSIHSTTNNNELGALADDKATLLPAKDATTTTKRTMAGDLSVYDAVLYSGLGSAFSSENAEDYGYSTKDGTIVYYEGLSTKTDYKAFSNSGTAVHADNTTKCPTNLAGFSYVKLSTVYRAGTTPAQTSTP